MEHSKLITQLRRLPRGTLIRKETTKWAIWNSNLGIEPVVRDDIGTALSDFEEMRTLPTKSSHQKTKNNR